MSPTKPSVIHIIPATPGENNLSHILQSESSSGDKSNERIEVESTLPELVSPAIASSSENRSSGELQLAQSRNPTVVLEALVRFQACILMLSDTVIGLYESLKTYLPGSSDISLESNINSCCNMIDNTIRPIVRKLSHSKISLDNSIFKGLDGSDSKNDIIVSVSNDSIPSSVNTDSSQESIVPNETTSCGKKAKKAPSRCIPIWLVRYTGIILALFASLCMSLVTLVVKFMEGYHPVSKVIWRLQGVLIPSVFFVLFVKYYQKKPLVTGNKEEMQSSSWKWKIFILLIFRGLVGCAADIFQYYSLKFLPLADSTVISFSTPIFVCVIAHFVLKEKIGVVPIFTAVLTLCGVIVISRPPILTGEESMNAAMLLGNVLAALCMMSSTTTTVIMRYLANVHFSVTMLALGIFGTIEGFIVSIFTNSVELPVHNAVDWYLAVMIAALFFIGQLAMTLALQMEEAGVVSLVRTGDVIFAFIWQVHFLQQEANIYSYWGASIVTLGVIITGLRKWVAELPEHSRIRSRLYFILR